LSFGNKNPETKIKILFRTKKFRIENNTFWKKNPEKRLLCFGNKNSETKMKNPFWIKKKSVI